MSAYLCAFDLPRIYPSFGDHPDYDPAQHTIASDAYHVPLMWMACFRPSNWQEHGFEVDGETIRGRSAIAPRDEALRNLRDAVPVLNQIFGKWGPVDSHAEVLAAAIEQTDGKFVSMEIAEVAYDDRNFYVDVQRILAHLANPEVDRPLFLDAVVRVTGLRANGKFPTAMSRMEGVDLSEDDDWNLWRLLGGEFIRPTPWDTAGAGGTISFFGDD